MINRGIGMARGRKPGKREPNGRLSRRRTEVSARLRDALDRDERDTISVAVEARQRVWQVPQAQSRDQMAGSFMGRLCLAGEISRIQYEAALLWIEASEKNSIACRSPRPPGAVDLNRTIGRGSDYEDVAAVTRWREQYEAASKAVQEAQNHLRGTASLFAALYECVIQDRAFVHMVPDCRLALNALAKHYKIDGGQGQRAA